MKGVSPLKPNSRSTAVKYIFAMVFLELLCQPVTDIAPSFRESFGSGTTSSSSTVSLKPRPEHSGHAPNGLLKENILGVSSSMLMPQSGQA